MNKALLLSSLLSIAINGSAQSTLVAGSAKVKEGYYTGSNKLFTFVFLKVTNDTAIADFIHVEKFPRSLYTDTLFYDVSNNTWQGKTVKLYQKGNKWRISNGNSKMKIKSNETYYKEQIDRKKNAALSRKDYEDYFTKNEKNEEARKRYEELTIKYDINNLANTLKHADFLKEYEKFKIELTKSE